MAEPALDGIEALPRQRDEIAGPGQSAAGGAQVGPRGLDKTPRAALEASAQILVLGDQVAVHRHRPLRRLGRGRRAGIGDEVDQGPVGLVADRRDQRNGAVAGGADHDLLVEAPQVFEAAAAARDDQNVRVGECARPVGRALKPRIAVAISAALPSPWTRTGHSTTWAGKRSSKPCIMSRITAPVGDVMTPTTRGRNGSATLARVVEQALGGELLLALLEQRHQGADAGRLECLDDDLVLRRIGIGGDSALGDHLHALFRLDLQASE